MSKRSNGKESHNDNDEEDRNTVHDRSASDPAVLSSSSLRSEATSTSNDPSSNSSHQHVAIAPAVMLPGSAAGLAASTAQSATATETRSRLESYAAAAQTYALLRSQYVESQQRQALSAYSSLLSQPQLPWLLRQMAPPPSPAPVPVTVPAATPQLGLNDPIVQAILQAVSQQNTEQARLLWQQLQLVSAASPSPGGATLPAVLQQHLPGSSQLTAMVSQTDILPQLQALLAARAQASTGRVPGAIVEPTATATSASTGGVVAKAAPRGSMTKGGGTGGGARSASRRGDRSASTLLELRPKPVSEETKPLQTEIVSVTKRRKKRKYTHESFPRKLYRLLEETAIAGRSHVISFTASGTAFRVHNPDAFARDIIPIYFRHSQYPSFQRQLSMYGFERIVDGPESGAYRHALFQQGHPLLCDEITRVCEQDEFNRKKNEDPNRKPPAT